MNRIALFVCLTLISIAAGAQTIDEWDGDVKPVTNRIAVLAELPDGGCKLVDACGRLESKDAGSVKQSCEAFNRELKGANLNTCLAVLGKTGNLWCSRVGGCASDSGL